MAGPDPHQQALRLQPPRPSSRSTRSWKAVRLGRCPTLITAHPGLAQQPVEVRFGGQIQGADGFIEHHEGRPPPQQAGEAQPLLLSGGSSSPTAPAACGRVYISWSRRLPRAR